MHSHKISIPTGMLVPDEKVKELSSNICLETEMKNFVYRILEDKVKQTNYNISSKRF